MTLLKIQETYANKERCKLSEQKSNILIFNQNKKPHLEDGIWSLNDKKLEIVEHYTHVGIERSPFAHLNLSFAIDEAIKTARKTAYSLMGASFHGLNGINPYVGLKLWNLYIKPRILYGLECLTLRKQDIQRLSVSKENSQILNAPPRKNCGPCNLYPLRRAPN